MSVVQKWRSSIHGVCSLFVIVFDIGWCTALPSQQHSALHAEAVCGGTLDLRESVQQIKARSSSQPVTDGGRGTRAPPASLPLGSADSESLFCAA